MRLVRDGYSLRIQPKTARAFIPEHGDRGTRSRNAKINSDPSKYDHNAAMQLAPVRGAVGFLARTVAASDLVLQEKTGGQWRQYAGLEEDIPLWLNEQRRPNRRQDRYDMRYMFAANMLAGGNGFAVINTVRDGFPDSIIAPPGYMVSPYGRSVFETATPNTEFAYSVNGQEMLPYSSVQRDGKVLHARLETRTDMLWGTSPLMEGAPTLRAALAAEAHAELFFSQGGMPPAVLAAMGEADEDSREALTEYYDRHRDNPDERHRPLVLDGDWKWIQTFINPEMMQLLDTRKFAWSAVSAGYGMPPPLIGHPDVSTWGTGVRALVRFAQIGAASPLLNHISWLFSELLPDDMRTVLVPSHLVEAEPLEKARYYDRAIRSGWLRRSEVRELENLIPIPGIDDEPLNGPGSPGDSDSGKDDDSTDNVEDSV